MDEQTGVRPYTGMLLGHEKGCCNVMHLKSIQRSERRPAQKAPTIRSVRTKRPGRETHSDREQIRVVRVGGWELGEAVAKG